MNRLSTGETFGEAMPMHDLCLIRFPTEKDFPAIPEGRKIDETYVKVLEQASQGFDLLDCVVVFFQDEFGLSFEAEEFVPAESVAVAGRLLANGLQGLLSFLKFLSPGVEILQDYSKLGKEGVRLPDREVSLRHQYLSSVVSFYRTEANQAASTGNRCCEGRPSL